LIFKKKSTRIRKKNLAPDCLSGRNLSNGGSRFCSLPIIGNRLGGVGMKRERAGSDPQWEGTTAGKKRLLPETSEGPGMAHSLGMAF
jgi:hypothetical protein